jgi:hypothetical protein
VPGRPAGGRARPKASSAGRRRRVRAASSSAPGRPSPPAARPPARRLPTRPQEAAQEVALAPGPQGKASKLAALLRALDSGPLAAWLARALICSYYANQAFEGWETWRRLQDAGVRAGLRRCGGPA